MHMSVVPEYTTLYQLGINWSSWVLKDGVEMFGCSRLCCFGLWTAPWSWGTQWLSQCSLLLWLGPAFVENTVRTPKSLTRDGTQVWILLCKQMANGMSGHHCREAKEKQQMNTLMTTFHTVNAEHIGLLFLFLQTDNAYNLLISQLRLFDLRTSTCCSDTPTLSEMYLFCLNSKFVHTNCTVVTVPPTCWIPYIENILTYILNILNAILTCLLSFYC